MKHKKTVRKKLYKPKKKSMKKTGGVRGDIDVHGVATEAHGDATEAHGVATEAHGVATEAVPTIRKSDFVTRGEQTENFLHLLDANKNLQKKIEDLEQKVDSNRNVEDLYKILRANNIEAYNFNDSRRADMEALMQNDYKRFRWYRLCMLRNMVGESERVLDSTYNNTPPKGVEFFNAAYGIFPAHIFTENNLSRNASYKGTVSATLHPAKLPAPVGTKQQQEQLDRIAVVHRYFDYNKKNSDCCLYDEDSLEKSPVTQWLGAEQSPSKAYTRGDAARGWVPYPSVQLNVYLRTSEDRGHGRTGLAEFSDFIQYHPGRPGGPVTSRDHEQTVAQHTHLLNFSSYKLLSPNSPFIQVEGVGRNHAVEFDHKGVKYLKDAINNVWELENPEYVTNHMWRGQQSATSVGNQRDYILRLKDISLGSIRHITAPIDIEKPEDRLIDVITLGLHPSQESLPIPTVESNTVGAPEKRYVFHDAPAYRDPPVHKQYCNFAVHSPKGGPAHLHDATLLDPRECQRQYRSHFVPLIDGDEFLSGKKYTVRGGKYLGWYDEEQEDIKPLITPQSGKNSTIAIFNRYD